MAYESDSLGRHPVSTVALTFQNGPDSSLNVYRYFSVSISLPFCFALFESIALHTARKYDAMVFFVFTLCGTDLYSNSNPESLFSAAVFLQARKINGVGFYDLNTFLSLFFIVYFSSFC